jgi:mannose-6-phosphate isomerase-like protein (cupin superfamily)/catechol 2,3-dioxygenase-like lactoylglutathione lyase family enzyme
MQIVGLDHIQLAMPAGAEAAARHFYGELLGLAETAKPAALVDSGGCWFSGHGVQVHLGVEQEFAPARKAHPAFLVADLSACRERLAQAGIPTTPDEAVPGVRRFYAADPFGNRIEFIQNGDGFGQDEQTQVAPQGYLLGPGQGVPGSGPDLKASHASTGGAITLIESRTTGGAPMHVHSREDECFYVVEGTIAVRCGDEIFEAGPRSFVFLPRGIPHDWDVAGGGEATVLIITVPGGFENFLHEHHAAGSQPNEVKDQIAAKYGIRWVRKPS